MMSMSTCFRVYVFPYLLVYFPTTALQYLHAHYSISGGYEILCR